MQIEIRGVNETIENLARIDRQLKDTSAAMHQATLLVTGSAKRNAPVDTGLLRASITPEVESRDNETVGVVGSNVTYAPFMELGTIPHWPPLAALETWARRHGTTAYIVARAIARRGLRPRHYLGRALDDNRGRIERIFSEYVKRVIQ